jgi:MinD-like ATPase involved in chromosome partitioning or flagellar assembly
MAPGKPAPGKSTEGRQADGEQRSTTPEPGVSPWQSRQARRLAGRGGTTPWRRRLAVLAGVFRSDDEPERRTRATTRCQTAVSTGRRVAVVAAHGGAGATTVTVGLGMVLATIRNDQVSVVAGRADRQALQHRVGLDQATNTRAVRDLLVAHQSDPNVASLDHLAVPDVKGLRAATESDDHAVVTEGADHLSRRHSVTLVDVGPITDHPVLATSHGIVVVGRLSIDGVAHVHGVLGELAGRVPLRRLQVVLVESGLDTGVNLPTAQKLLKAYDVPVSSLPSDLHLATGTRVSLPQLSDPAAVALTEVAAQAFDIVTARS